MKIDRNRYEAILSASRANDAVRRRQRNLDAMHAVASAPRRVSLRKAGL